MLSKLKKTAFTLFIFIVILSLTACISSDTEEDTHTDVENDANNDANQDVNNDVEKEDNNVADILITNASVFSADEANTPAEAIAIKDDVITYVGNNAEAEKLAGANTKIIDANKGTVMPGIVDSHMHPAMSAITYLYEINLFDANDTEEYIKIGKKFVEENPDSEVYVGSGYNRSFFDRVGPRKENLDKISSDKPVIITSGDGHSKWVNSKALENANITKDTPDPEGGVIQRDPDTGEPSGLLQESAMLLVQDQSPVYTKEEYKEAILWVQEWFNELGLTSVFDAMVDIDNEDYYGAYQELAEENKLTLRVRGAWHIYPEMADDISGYEAYIENAINQSKEFTTDFFQINAFKFFSDQVLEEETGYLMEPYSNSDDGWRGIKTWNDETMESLFTKIDEEDFQLHIHQIGDAAADYSLDALEKVQKTNGEKDSRHSFAHVQLLNDKDAQRMADLKMNAIIAPYWMTIEDYYWELNLPYLGQERVDNSYPAKSLVDKGINLATHSDFFVSEPDTGWLFYGAVMRTIPQRIHDLWYGGTDITRTTDTDVEVEEPNVGPLKKTKERMKIEEVMKASTYGGAYTNFMENEIGSIEEGKKADLIMYNIDLQKADIEDVSNVAPALTLFNGEIVFEND